MLASVRYVDLTCEMCIEGGYVRSGLRQGYWSY